MATIITDGGRKGAGFKGTARDCVCRAIAVASRKPYREVWEYIAAHCKGTADKGVFTAAQWFKDYMASLGFVWQYTNLLLPEELPVGRVVVKAAGHFYAIIDGNIYDGHNSKRRKSYGHWILT